MDGTARRGRAREFRIRAGGRVQRAECHGSCSHGGKLWDRPPQIVEALKSFKSVKRRLEMKGEIGGITIIDDFAHHPMAIAATLGALRVRYPGARLWAIFEPR